MSNVNPELKKYITNHNVPFTVDQPLGGMKVSVPVKYSHKDQRLKTVTMTNSAFSNKEFTGYLVSTNIEAMNNIRVSGINLNSIPESLMEQVAKDGRTGSFKVFAILNKNRKGAVKPKAVISKSKVDNTNLLTNEVFSSAYSKIKEAFKSGKVMKAKLTKTSEVVTLTEQLWFKIVKKLCNKFTEEDMTELRTIWKPVNDGTEYFITPSNDKIKSDYPKKHELMTNFWNAVFVIHKGVHFQDQEQMKMKTNVSLKVDEVTALFNAIRFCREQMGKVKSVDFMFLIDSVIGKEESDLLLKEEVGTLNMDMRFDFSV